MNQEFERRGHRCRIERRTDDSGRHMITVFIDRDRFPYNWQKLKPLSPTEYARSLADSMPEVETAHAPPESLEAGASPLIYRGDEPVIL
jgi:hypothetical protein